MAGITTYVGAGLKPNITPDGLGGVFYGLIVFTGNDAGATDRRTFWDLGGRSVYVLAVKGGVRPWQQGVDGNGYPYFQTQGYPVPSWRSAWPEGAFDDTYAVFLL